MSTDATGFSTLLTLVASVTFPAGFPVRAFPDNVDPIDFPSLQVADAAMGVNGDFVSWKKANPVPFSFAVLPNTPEEYALEALLQANRPAQGKKYVNDDITIVIVYPNFRVATLSKGKLMEGIPASGIETSQRIKTRSYKFMFQDLVVV